MQLFVYCYNVVFVLLFAVALSACFMTYGVTEKKVFRHFGTLMFAYIFESIYVAIVIVADFNVSTDLLAWIYLFSLLIFSVVEVNVVGKIVYNLFGKTESCMLYTVPLTGLAVATVGLSIPGELGALLTMNMFSFTTLVFCGLYGYLLKRKTGCYENAARYKVLMGVMGGSSILAILENIIYVFWANVFVDELLPFYENQINFFEDGFCLILSVWLVLFTKKEREKYMSQKIETILQQRMNEFQVRQQEKSKMVGKEQLVEFCKYYGLTERETEILRLILEGKSNQELSEELYITVGTVKAHAHSIFGKLEVSRRSQLMTMFMNYGTK